MRRLAVNRTSILVAILFLCYAGLAQSPGIPDFSPIHSDAIDTVKVFDGSILIDLPIWKKSALIPFSYSLETQVYVATGSSTIVSPFWGPGVWVGMVNGKMVGPDSDFNLGNLTPSFFHTNCANGQPTIQYYRFSYRDPKGVGHAVGSQNGGNGIVWDSLHCLGAQVYSAWTTDGEYYVTSSQTTFNVGSAIDTGGNGVEGLGDPNGNFVGFSYAGNGNFPWSDSTGVSPLSETQVTSGAWGVGQTGHLVTDTHTWTDENGNPQSAALTYSPYTQKTIFQCTGNPDINGVTAYFPSTIVTPEGTYNISYEATPGFPSDVTGRIAKITFPSGASVQYSYSGGTNGLMCIASNGPIRVPLLTRTLTDATGKVRIWRYDTQTINNATVVTDPNGNDTVYNFIPGASGRSPNAYLETHYQGLRTAGNILKTITYCLNGNTPTGPNGGCAAPSSLPYVTELDHYITFPGMAQYHSDQTLYDAHQNISEEKKYDFGSVLISDTKFTYGSYSNGSCATISTTIVNRVCTSIVTDATGNIAAQSRNSYDSHGNLTSASQWVSGTTWLTKTVTPNANGTPASTTDVNGSVTNYTYNACNGTFPTQVSIAGLTTNMTWNCTGGVMLTRTDANNQPTTFDYKDYNTGTADPFWRLKSITDPLGNVTTATYTATTRESSLVFNGGASTTDKLTTEDGFGRTLLVQKRQSPSSTTFDTTTYVYDGNGNLASTSMPCSVAAGVSCPTTPATTQTYDGLNRPLVRTDGGTGTLTRTYSKNDVLLVRGPAPAGEHTKSRQFEYDGLGRLTSVCEILASGGSSCGQSTSASGYKTSYAYSVPAAGGTKFVVTQGAQTRTFVRDGLARLISETNPESGATQYVYDSDPGAPGTSCATLAQSWTAPYNWAPPYNGDLVKKYDANGNTSCYTYDGLHRNVMTIYGGPNTTTNRFFAYDSATVNGATMGNAATHLAEAFTASCPICAKATDEGFGYTQRGEPADIYESTAHSGGYYHVALGYWANGTPKTLNGYLASGSAFIPTETYTPDGEGRWNSVAASSGPNPILSTAYNVAGQITGITYGSSDTDSFTYDPNTGRMTQFKYTLNGSSEIGNLTWNANASLGTLAITDPFNSNNSQTCNYGYDDLARITNANCGSVFSQTFSYDQFGNLTKSGSIAWQPGYNSSTNRYTLAGTSYDANGNLLNDTFRSYVWDANGRPTTTGTKTLTYDGQGRMAEKLDGGTYSQFLYSPTGSLLAVMNGQSATSVRVPLPGALALYSATNTFNHYEHFDWLGNSRLSSTQARAMLSDIAYAPFGEPYASTTSTGVSFTGMRSDVVAATGATTNGLYDFLARELPPTQGRWLSPDPDGIKATNPENPQSWNRYAYLLNEPLTTTDPTGMGPCSGSSRGTTNIGGSGDGQQNVGGGATGAQNCEMQSTSTTYGISEGDGTRTYSQTTDTVTQHADGSMTSVSTATTYTYSTREGHEGQFIGATTQTTTVNSDSASRTITTTGPHAINYGQAVRAIGAGTVTALREGAQPSYLTHLTRAIGTDMKAHPFYYIAVGLGGAAIPFVAAPAAVAIPAGVGLGAGSITAGVIDKTWY